MSSRPGGGAVRSGSSGRPARPERPRGGAGQSVFPSVSEILDPGGPFLVPLVLLVLTRGALWMLMPLATEDAYIAFRYARNLVEGNGLVYNPGERVIGFSSPLWTLWSALGLALVRDPVLWARIWALVADAVTVCVAGHLLKRHASVASAWSFTTFFAAWPYFSAAAVSGMENGVLLSLVFLTAALVGARNPAGGPALAILALLRPEGLAAALVLSLKAGWRERAVGLGIVVLAWIAMAAYFGTIVPQSVVAKSQIYGTPGPWVARFWWEWLLPFQLGRWSPIGDVVSLSAMSVVLAPAFALGARALWKNRLSDLSRAAAAALVVWVGYSVLGVAFFWWYLAVPLGAVALVASVGLPSIVRGRAIVVACALFILGMWTLLPHLYIGRAHVESQQFGRVARLLRSRSTPGEKVMLEPIGMIGYRAPVTVVDEVGLVSPQVAERRLRGPGWYTDIEAQERPDWLVLRLGTMQKGTAFAGAGAPFRNSAERDSVLARYQLVDQGDGSAGDQTLVVLRRFR